MTTNEFLNLVELVRKTNNKDWKHNRKRFEEMLSEMLETNTKNAIENLALPHVVLRSEQLVCIHDITKLRLIGGDITCLDCNSKWIRQTN